MDFSSLQKSSHLGRGFIEAEAELSGDEEDHSGDESEDSDYDRYDDSFVCDATQASQAVGEYCQRLLNNQVYCFPLGRMIYSERNT